MQSIKKELEEYKEKCKDLELKLENQYKYNDELLTKLHYENDGLDMKTNFNSEVLSRLDRIEDLLIREDKQKEYNKLKTKFDDDLHELTSYFQNLGYYDGHR